MPPSGPQDATRPPRLLTYEQEERPPWKLFTTMLVVLTLMLLLAYAWLVPQRKPPAFDGKNDPVPIRLFAHNLDKDCISHWQEIVGKAKLVRGYFRLDVARGCADFTGEQNLPTNVVSVVLDANFPLGAGSKRLRDCNSFVIAVNPKLMTVLDLSHELLHILNGDTCIKHPGMPRLVANSFLDWWIEVQQLIMWMGVGRVPQALNGHNAAEIGAASTSPAAKKVLDSLNGLLLYHVAGHDISYPWIMRTFLTQNQPARCPSRIQ